MGSKIFEGGLKLNDCEPADWFVVFHEKTTHWWLGWLAFGRFKHVSAFGFVDRAQTWLFFDLHLDRTRIYAVGNHEADIALGHYSNAGTIVRMARPIGQEAKVRWAIGGWCVPAVAHLIGLRSCALRPDTLFRQCLANGGEIIGDEGQKNEETRSRSGASEAAAGRQSGEGEQHSGASLDAD